MNQITSRQESIEKLQEMIKGINIAMLTTAADDGSLRSRPMATQETEFDGNLWFLTCDNSPKADEVRREHHVNVSYASPEKGRYLSVSGLGEIIRDHQKVKEFWSPIHKAYFPEGLDDPSLAVLKVSVTQAEYWDDTSSKMVQLFKLAKSVVTGTAYEAENKKLNLR